MKVGRKRKKGDMGGGEGSFLIGRGYPNNSLGMRRVKERGGGVGGWQYLINKSHVTCSDPL